ncbi:hypothetical protein FA15DRAFT_673815 [Coprinopsis marcescibilis]|uniref:CBM1 domain-containing protein n=1 Tax=Coprinopsis marcescibilis TaxID=230819 RepID=A0A5C3KIL2_COPMA|nr:hypothetical protein FA15DRAFT_673815 [Coprinopsis marcescibilis]
MVGFSIATKLICIAVLTLLSGSNIAQACVPPVNGWPDCPSGSTRTFVPPKTSTVPGQCPNTFCVPATPAP